MRRVSETRNNNNNQNPEANKSEIVQVKFDTSISISHTTISRNSLKTLYEY